MTEIVEGSSVQFEAGPFLSTDGTVLNLTGYAVKLQYRKPNGTTGAFDGLGSADGYMRCTPAAGVLTPVGVWEARLEGVSGGGGTTRRYGDLVTVRVVPVAGYAP